MKDNFRIAVIVTSSMARKHMDGIVADPRTTLAAVCDTYEERLLEIKKDYSLELTVTDYRELVNRDDIDAVVLVTPDQTHLEMTEAFLRAGKHVLCEKPMALTVEECEKMMQVEKETGNMLMIGQICRCTPAFVLAKKLIEEGKIGDLTFIESEYAHYYGFAEGVDSWRKTPERHGFIGGGCHALDLLRWIAGNPEEVMAYSNHKNLLDWPNDDTMISIFRFPNQVIGKVFCSIGCKRGYTMRTVLYGTKGTIICDNSSPTLTLFTEVDNPEDKKAFVNPVEIPVEINHHNATEEIKVFVDALASGGKSPIPSSEGANTVAACCAAVKSMSEGMPVKINYPVVSE